MTRDERSAQAAGIAGLSFIAAALCVPLAYLSTQFRHVAPQVREWLIVNVEAAHQVVAAWIA